MDTIFLDSIYKNIADYVYLWTPQKKLSYQFRATETAAIMAKAEELSTQKMDVFYSLGARHDRLKSIRLRAKQNEISQLGTMWVDIDIAGDNAEHAANNLPPDIPSAMSLLPDKLPPSIIVSSGHGLHAYWLLDEPVSITDDNRELVINTSKKIQQLVRNNAEKRGWHIDPVADLSRILRLPGTWNYKTDPVLCEVIDAQYELRYDFDMLAALTVDVPERKKNRNASFERRESDGDGKYMLANCRFLQHCQVDAATLTYDEWLAMITNVSRASDGQHLCHELSKLDDKRYDARQTDDKINESLNNMSPATCEYIQKTLNFRGCDACNVRCPSSWSLAALPKSKAIIREISMPSAENVFTSDVIGSLALLQEKDSMEFAKFKDRCRGHINLNDLSKEIAKKRRSAMHVVKDHVEAGDNAKSVTTQSILDDCPIDLVVPPGYAFSAAGIDAIKLLEGGGEMRSLASGSPVVITNRIFNLDREQEKIELCFKYYNQWRRTVQPRSVIFNSRSVIKIADYGIDVTSESSKYLVKYLQALGNINQAEIPLVYGVSKLGWRNHDTEFILPTKTNYRIDLDDEGNITSAFAESGTMNGWLALAEEVRQQPYARIVLAAGFAAPLLKISPHKRNFLLYFWGPSGGGKTAAIKFALSPWGEPDRLMTSFLTTKNGLERRLELLSDFPAGINERQVAGAGRDKQEQLEYIAYMLEGGKGKGRANKTGLQRTSSWRVVGIANGEEPLTKESSMQGVKNRVLEINTSPLMPDDLARRCHVNEHYGIAGPLFIEQLLKQKATVSTVYHDIATYIMERYKEYSATHISAVALLATTDYLVSAWLFGLSPQEAMNQCIEMATTLMRELPTLDQLSDVARGWELVMNWISANNSKFLRDKSERYVPPIYGFYRGDKLYIYPEMITAALEAAGFSPTKLLREFALSGKIKSTYEASTGKTRFRCKTRDLGGKPVRVIILDAPEELFPLSSGVGTEWEH